MSDATNWHEIISSMSSVIAVFVSVVAIWRSSKQKQNDQLTNIEKSLNDHILQDAKDITSLNVKVENIESICTTKLDEILDHLKDD